MMIPEAWENHADDGSRPAAFYEFHSTFMEPWDGPACVTFTDGTQIGAVRPQRACAWGRYWVTDDGLVVPASESGVLDLAPRRVIVARVACSPAGCSSSTPPRPHHQRRGDQSRSWPPSSRTRSGCTPVCIHLGDLPDREHIQHTAASVARRQRPSATPPGGRTQDHPAHPDGRTGGEALGSMGHRHPIAVLSDKPAPALRLLHPTVRAGDEPPLDAIREELVTSLGTSIGPEGTLDATRRTSVRWCSTSRFIDNDELAKIVHINADGDLPGYATAVSSKGCTTPTAARQPSARLDEICTEV